MSRIDFHAASRSATTCCALRACGLVIEAIVEDLAAKQTLFRRLEAVVRARRGARDEHVVALGRVDRRRRAQSPERVIGIHFFNPAPVMPLVEVVPWLGGDAGR